MAWILAALVAMLTQNARIADSIADDDTTQAPARVGVLASLPTYEDTTAEVLP
jgi:hypothetical protein